MKSVMSHSFSQVPKANIPRSSFNRSHGHKTTFDAGELIPIMVDEALPGDTLNLRASLFGRLATPINPIMDNMFLDTFYFAVPMRLVWDNWQKFCGEQDNPDDSTDYLIPTLTSPAGGYTYGSLSDYMGIPTDVAGIEHSSLWHRAYNLIYNEWFKDQNLQDAVPFTKADGPDTPTDYSVLKRGKRHDYFTSCLPWPQKGEEVLLPLGTSAPVEVINGEALQFNDRTLFNGIAGSSTAVRYAGADQGNLNVTDVDGLECDLTNATAATINQLREAFQVQKMYERDARGGTRYTEIVRSHFGVISPDARLQRPEYLGGSSVPININPIAQTSESSTTPQGNLAAIGTVADSRGGFVKSFTEHCLIIGLVSLRADLNYQQGLNRMFSRKSRFDFYWPALSHIGEQAVLSKEIYVDGTANDEEVFGYQERYAEYRYKPSVITGKFRSSDAQSLDTWHLGQDFASRPTLSATFIEENPPVDRIIAVPSEPHIILDTYFDYKCARPMPLYSVPGMIDHF